MAATLRRKHIPWPGLPSLPSSVVRKSNNDINISLIFSHVSETNLFEVSRNFMVIIVFELGNCPIRMLHTPVLGTEVARTN
jgi:hypothetical protein